MVIVRQYEGLPQVLLASNKYGVERISPDVSQGRGRRLLSSDNIGIVPLCGGSAQRPAKTLSRGWKLLTTTSALYVVRL